MSNDILHIVHPLHGEGLKRTLVKIEGSVQAAYEAEKTEKYRETCKEEDVIFRPVCIDAFGGWGPGAQSILDTIAQRAAIEAGTRRDEVARHLQRRVGFAIARANAQAITMRMGDKEHVLLDNMWCPPPPPPPTTASIAATSPTAITNTNTLAGTDVDVALTAEEAKGCFFGATTTTEHNGAAGGSWNNRMTGSPVQQWGRGGQEARGQSE